MKNLLTIIKAFILAIVFIYIIGALWLIPFNYLLPNHFYNFQATTLEGRIIERFSFLLSFWATIGFIHFRYENFESLLPSTESNWNIRIKKFSGVSLLTFICLGITYLISFLFGFIEIDFSADQLLLTDFFRSMNYILLIGVFGHFLVALGEEAVYRSLIFRYLLKKTSNKDLALLISAVIFALFHFHYSAPFSFIAAFLAGYLLALIYYHSGSLLYCISIHWTYNLFMHIFTPASKDYMINYFSLHLQQIAGWGSYFSLIRIGAFILIIILIKRALKYKAFKPKFLT